MSGPIFLLILLDLLYLNTSFLKLAKGKILNPLARKYPMEEKMRENRMMGGSFMWHVIG